VPESRIFKALLALRRVGVIASWYYTVDLAAGRTYECGGAFYAAVPRGYEVIPPPIGVAVQSLPNDSTLETVHAVSYFTYGSAWYRPSYSAGGVSYMVVAKPG
jgi:hypothetical protein